MRTLLTTLFLVFSLSLFPAFLPGIVVAPAAAAEGFIPNGASPSFADLAEKLLPSVVNISSTQKMEKPEDFPEMPHFPPGSPFEDFFEEFMDRQGQGFQSLPQASLGSGFIINAEKGYIVTNNHVVKDADEVRVTFHNDVTVEAEVLGRDEKIDLAVLQVKTEEKLVAVDFGNSDVLRVGDWILAIGNPFGLGGTVTAGIISAQQRNINAGPYDDFIQTDASINRGNSGGPMFNLKGDVIGINTAIFSPSGGSVGIGFAVPANLAEPAIQQLIEFGHTRRGWLGVRIQSVTEEIAESLGLEESAGALVASVTPEGPAEKAGFEPGDVILKFDGKKIDEMRNLPRVVAETPIGKEVKVRYWRDGEEGKTSVTVGELEKAEEEGLLETGPRSDAKKSGGVEIESVGLTLNSISSDDRDENDIPDDIDGVLITDIEPLSEAAEKGLMPGDVVVELNQKAVTNPQKASDIIEKAKKGGRSSVLLLVNRGGDVRFVALRLKKD